MFFISGEDITLVESGSGYIRVCFDSSGPSSKLFNVVKYFASFDRTIWLIVYCQVQAGINPFNKDLVKFVKLRNKEQACPVTGYRVRFDYRTPEILAPGSSGLKPLSEELGW